MESPTTYSLKTLPWYGYFLLFLSAMVLLSFLSMPLNMEYYRMQHDLFISIGFIGYTIYLLYAVQLVAQIGVIYYAFKPVPRGYTILLVGWISGLLSVLFNFVLTVVRPDLYGSLMASEILRQAESEEADVAEVLIAMAPYVNIMMQVLFVFSAIFAAVFLYIYIRNRGYFLDAASYKKKKSKVVSAHAEGEYTFGGL